MLKFKDNATYNKDYNTIILALAKIIDKGALERFFRIEGKMSDNVAALSIDSRKLRLYCLRISDQILILGNVTKPPLPPKGGVSKRAASPPSGGRGLEERHLKHRYYDTVRSN